MIDPATLAKMRSRLSAFTPYRKRVRPAAATSLPPFLDGEFQTLSTNLADIKQVLADLDARLVSLGG